MYAARSERTKRHEMNAFILHEAGRGAARRSRKSACARRLRCARRSALPPRHRARCAAQGAALVSWAPTKTPSSTLVSESSTESSGFRSAASVSSSPPGSSMSVSSRESENV
jgi:hypothetical protein